MSDKESTKAISETKSQIEGVLAGHAGIVNGRWLSREGRRRLGSKECRKRALVMALDFLNRAKKNEPLAAALEKKIRDDEHSVRGNAIPHIAFIRLLFPEQSAPTEYRLGCALKYACDQNFSPRQFYADMEKRNGYTGYVAALKGKEESQIRKAKATKNADDLKLALKKSGVKLTSDGHRSGVNLGEWFVALGRRKTSTSRVEYFGYQEIDDASLLRLTKLFPGLKSRRRASQTTERKS